MCINEEAEEQQEDAHCYGGEEFNGEQVWPGHHRVVWLFLDADHRVLLHQGKESVWTRRHWHALLVNLRAARRINRRDWCWALLVAHRRAPLIVAR